MVNAAFAWRRLLRRTTVIAVVGSLGKTTTRELLHAVLSTQGAGVASAKNRNGHTGVAMALLRTRPWHRHCVLEIGVAKPGDMAPLARLARPDLVLFINVGRCHLNVFRTVEAVTAEKAQVFEPLASSARALVNTACPELAALTLPSAVQRIDFHGERPAAGTHAPSDATSDSDAATPAESAWRLVSATSVWPDPLTVTLAAPDGREHRIRTALHGTHWANSVVAVVAAADVLGVPLDAAQRALLTVPNWHRRLEPIALGHRGATVVRDDYNGSIDSYSASLAWLAEARAQRRIVVYGHSSDFQVPGGDRKRAVALAKRVAAAADHVVAITPYEQQVVRAAGAVLGDEQCVTALPSVEAAIQWCRRELRDGDLVLLKGRGDEKLERVFLGLFADVSCTLDACELKLGCARCPQLGFSVTPAMQRGQAELAPSVDQDAVR